MASTEHVAVFKMWSGSYLQILTPKFWQIGIITTQKLCQDKTASLPLCSEAGKNSQTRVVSFSCVGIMCFPFFSYSKEIPLLCLMHVVYPGISGQLSLRVVWWWNAIVAALSEQQLALPVPLLPETAAKYFLLAKNEEVYWSIHLY